MQNEVGRRVIVGGANKVILLISRVNGGFEGSDADWYQGCPYFLAPTSWIDVDVLNWPKKDNGGEVG